MISEMGRTFNNNYLHFKTNMSLFASSMLN